MAAFCHQLPAWCGPDGFPRSWRLYQYGLAYLGRAHLRQQLAHAEAHRLGGATEDSYTQWHRSIGRRLEPTLSDQDGR